MPDPGPRRMATIKRMIGFMLLLDDKYRWHTVHELAHEYNERNGTTYCLRTFRRDLALLEELGLIEVRSIMTVRGHDVMVYRTCQRLPGWLMGKTG